MCVRVCVALDTCVCVCVCVCPCFLCRLTHTSGAWGGSATLWQALGKEGSKNGHTITSNTACVCVCTARKGKEETTKHVCATGKSVYALSGFGWFLGFSQLLRVCALVREKPRPWCRWCAGEGLPKHNHTTLVRAAPSPPSPAARSFRRRLLRSSIGDVCAHSSRNTHTHSSSIALHTCSFCRARLLAECW